MNKKGAAVVAAVAAVVAVAAAASAAYQPPPGGPGPQAGEVPGGVSTAMGSPVLGDPSAPVTIIEFGDYQCHQCYNWFHNTKPAITREYIEPGKASLVFVDMAFLGRDSGPAAQASHCAGDQGAYWEYHDLLYSSQESRIDNGWAGGERLRAFAFDIGLDMGAFDGCMGSGEHADRVRYNTDQALGHGATGTPTFVIVGPDGRAETLVGAQPYASFKMVLDSMV